MEFQLENGKYNVAFSDANLDVNVVESTPLNVVVGESARIEVGEAINYIKTGTSEIEEAVRKGIASFDSNATEKTSDFNTNATEKTSDFNLNASEKTADFNTNAQHKASEYNTNASEKLSEYNSNATEKLNAYNSNATEKLNAYNSNASDKVSEFNANYTEKKALIDAQVDIAEEQANIATSQAQTATVEASNARTSASNALESEQNSKESEINALNSANSASDSASTAIAQADIATQKAEIATQKADIATQNAEIAIEKASEAIIAANESSISANNAEIWAEGSDSEVSDLGGTHSSKGWAEYAQEVLESKQDIIPDLATIRDNAQEGKNASDTIATYGNIVTHNANEFQPVGDYATNTALTQGLATKQNVINDLDTIRSNASTAKSIVDTHVANTTIHVTASDKVAWSNKQNAISDLEQIRTNAKTGSDLAPQVEVNTQRIEDLTIARFPNVIVKGTPQIIGGQVSGFSDTNYLQFPFVDISRGYPFDIYFSFTTANDVTNQQNVLDAYFGIALAIQNGKGIMALSSNGTSWDIGTAIGTNTITPNTTYYVKYSWTGTEYNASLSQDEQSYVPDMNLASTLSPHKTTIFIGGSPNIFGAGSAHPFKGTINFNKSRVVVNGITVWEGMADVGLASRANVSLNNLDEVGEARFTNILNETGSELDYTGNTLSLNNAKGDTLSTVTIKSTPDLDNSTISLNASDELQAIGVIEKNKGLAKYDWVGTKEEYEAQAVATNHPTWVCYITNDLTPSETQVETAILSIFNRAYPVGSLYITTANACPLQRLGIGTWSLVSAGRVLQGAGSGQTAGSTIDAGLPNITGSAAGNRTPWSWDVCSGALYNLGDSTVASNLYKASYDTTTAGKSSTIGLDASRSSSIYGKSSTVQPPAYLVNIFRRIL